MDDRLRGKLDRNRREIARQRTLRWTCRWTILVGAPVIAAGFYFAGREDALGKIAARAACVGIPAVLIAGVSLFFLGGLALGSKTALSKMTDREKRIIND